MPLVFQGRFSKVKVVFPVVENVVGNIQKEPQAPASYNLLQLITMMREKYAYCFSILEVKGHSIT